MFGLKKVVLVKKMVETIQEHNLPTILRAYYYLIKQFYNVSNFFKNSSS